MTTAPTSTAPVEDWSQRTLRELMQHIVARHHRFTREALAELVPLSREVARAHAARHPHLIEVAGLLRSLEDEMRSHFAAEEQILFPFIEELDVAARTPGAHRRPVHLESLGGPLHDMLFEHDHASDVLDALRVTTNGFTPPEDASPSYRAFLARLADLEKDLLRHIELEGRILIPRAKALAGV